MQKLSAQEILNLEIETLEAKQDYEIHALYEHAGEVIESLKPANLLKKAFNNVTQSKDIQHGLLNDVIGLTSGLLSKKLLLGKAASPIANIIGSALQFAVGTYVSKHVDTIKSIGSVLLSKFAARDEKDESS